MFVPRHDPVKIVRLRLTNTGGSPRRISAFSYARWVLGGLPQETGEHIETRWDDAADALLATNRSRGEFSERVAFAASIAPAADGASWTADRTAFLGAYGSAQAPAALRGAARLNGAAGAGLDPCAALQATFTIAPGETVEVAFLLGEAEDEAVCVRTSTARRRARRSRCASATMIPMVRAPTTGPRSPTITRSMPRTSPSCTSASRTIRTTIVPPTMSSD
jgi:cyclic beta-1,2-glucan synthetase